MNSQKNLNEELEILKEENRALTQIILQARTDLVNYRDLVQRQRTELDDATRKRDVYKRLLDDEEKEYSKIYKKIEEDFLQNLILEYFENNPN